MIRTERLDLLPATIPVLEAELAGPAELAKALRVEVAESWPPPLYDLEATRRTLELLRQSAEWQEWGLRYFVLRRAGSRGLAVGVGGYKGAPAADGSVEIGYSILPEHRRRGFASEAVEGLKERAYRDPRVERVVAETLPDLAPSIGVLRKTGFVRVEGGSEPGVIRFEHRRPG